jgi:hypothetical protein
MGQYQGTTLVVPKRPQNKRRALAPANFVPQHMPYSETCLTPEGLQLVLGANF